MTDTTTQGAASTTLITAADRSVKTLVGAFGQLSKLSAELQALGLLLETQAADIQQNESRLAHLDAEFDLKKRTAAANLNVAVLEDERRVLENLLAKNQLAFISQHDLEMIKADLTQAESDNSLAVEVAVKSAERELHASYDAKISGITNAHAVETATLKAEATSKDERIAFLATEITNLRSQIEAERNTRLEIAKAEANRQGVVVNAGNTR